MRRACLLAVLMIAVTPCTTGSGHKADEPPTGSDAQWGGETMNKKIPASADWEQGFPIPRGARRNDALGGATSVRPGRNYTLKVYDVDSGMEAMTAFYERHLPFAAGLWVSPMTERSITAWKRSAPHA